MLTVSQTRRKVGKRGRPKSVYADNAKVVCSLRAMRELFGRPLHEVAYHAGISPATLSKLERGAVPLVTTALRLARYFERPVEEIWKTKLSA